MADDDDDSTTNMALMAKQRFEEDRRRSRLFGSNARRVPGAARRKKKKKEPPPAAESIVDSSPSPPPSSKKALQQTECPTSRQNELSKSRPWAQTKKFVDPSKSKRVQTRPWHVGYSNAPTASGNPSAQAARYGPNGAFNLRIQCADRISRQAGKLEAILRNGDDVLVEQYNSISNAWSEPLRLGEAHLCSTPKMWGSESSIGIDKDGRLPQRLKKAIDNETDLWKEMALSVRAERDKQTAKSLTKESRRPNATAAATWRNQWGTATQCSSQQPPRVFCLR